MSGIPDTEELALTDDPVALRRYIETLKAQLTSANATNNGNNNASLSSKSSQEHSQKHIQDHPPVDIPAASSQPAPATPLPAHSAILHHNNTPSSFLHTHDDNSYEFDFEDTVPTTPPRSASPDNDLYPDRGRGKYAPRTPPLRGSFASAMKRTRDAAKPNTGSRSTPSLVVPGTPPRDSASGDLSDSETRPRSRGSIMAAAAAEAAEREQQAAIAAAARRAQAPAVAPRGGVSFAGQVSRERRATQLSASAYADRARAKKTSFGVASNVGRARDENEMRRGQAAVDRPPPPKRMRRNVSEVDSRRAVKEMKDAALEARLDKTSSVGKPESLHRQERTPIPQSPSKKPTPALENNLNNHALPSETPEFFPQKTHGAEISDNMDVRERYDPKDPRVEIDPFVGVRLNQRYFSTAAIRQQLAALPRCRVYNMAALYRTVCPPHFDAPAEANWVLFAVIAHKSKVMYSNKRVAETYNQYGAGAEDKRDRVGARPPVKAKKTDKTVWDPSRDEQLKFMMLTLTDLDNYEVSLALQGNAFEKYWKLQEGTLIALLNPGTYTTRRPGPEDTATQAEDSTQPQPPAGPAFGLYVTEATDSILEIGRAHDFAHCGARTLKGTPCRNWINRARAAACEYHTEQRLRGARGNRLEMNSAAGGRTVYATLTLDANGQPITAAATRRKDGQDVAGAPPDPVRRVGLLPDARQPMRVAGAAVYVRPAPAAAPFDGTYRSAAMPAGTGAGYDAARNLRRQQKRRARAERALEKFANAEGEIGDAVRRTAPLKPAEGSEGVPAQHKPSAFGAAHIRRIGFDPTVRPYLANGSGGSDTVSAGAAQLAKELRRELRHKELNLSMNKRKKRRPVTSTLLPAPSHPSSPAKRSSATKTPTAESWSSRKAPPAPPPELPADSSDIELEIGT